MREYENTWYEAAPDDAAAKRLLHKQANATPMTEDDGLLVMFAGVFGSLALVVLAGLIANNFVALATILELCVGLAALGSLIYYFSLSARFRRAVKQGQISRICPELRNDWLEALKAADVKEAFANEHLAAQHFRTLAELETQYQAHLVNRTYAQAEVKPRLATMAQELGAELELLQQTPAEQLRALHPHYPLGQLD